MRSLKATLADYQTSVRDLDDRPYYGRETLAMVLESSPVLKANVEFALARGDLKGFVFDSAALDGAGGSYDTRTGKIDIPRTAYANTAALVFVLGHENQHAISLRAQAEQPYVAKLRQDIDAIQAPAIIQGGAHTIPQPSPHGAPRDYTQAVRDYIEGVRGEEAQAHIGGFNALVSYATRRNHGQTPSLQELYETLPGRMDDFIERRGVGVQATYQLKQGLTLAEDGTLAFSPGNIDAMKKHYADNFPGSFGDNGLLDYRHQSMITAWKIVQAAEKPTILQASAEHYRDHIRGTSPHYAETDHAYKIDFAALGANPAVLRFPPDGVVRMVDTQQQLAALDAQRAPHNDPRRDAIQNSADQTENIVRGREDARRLLRDQGLLSGSASEKMADALYSARHLFSRNPDDPRPNVALAPAQLPQPVVAEPALLTQARQKLEDTTGTGDLGDRTRFENVAAALALQAHRDGLTRIDQVMYNRDGNMLIAVQGQDPAAVTARHAVVDIGAASQQVARDSTQQLQQLLVQAPMLANQPNQTKMLL
jgi:hypothetical protein